jgi:hypothetical protein
MKPHNVYGDGFTQESLPAASVGNRTVSVYIKINPPIITSENNQDRTLYFRWFDANTNQTIQHVTFLVLVTRHNQSLVEGLFHTHTGTLTLKIIPSYNQSNWKIIGNSQPFLDSDMYLPKANDTVDLIAPMLGEGGLYHIYMMLLTIDNDQNLFSPVNAPKFDSYLSVGDITNHTITLHNNSYDTTLVSYYDKNTNFIFDSAKMQISWTMPFDWNTTRFQNMPIFVHEELRIPKSFKEFATANMFAVSMNGNPISDKKIVADPYSINGTLIVHILLNKNDIANFANSSQLKMNTMNFTLKPIVTNIKTSSNIFTDFGGWEIKLKWNQYDISANSENQLQLTFDDAFTEQKTTGDVNYDFKILDKDRNIEFSKTDLTAKNGSDTQSINLPNNGIYSLEIHVKSIVNHNLIDTSRIGFARGNLVIPSIPETAVTEFPFSITALVVGIFLTLAFVRIIGNQFLFKK